MHCTGILSLFNSFHLHYKLTDNSVKQCAASMVESLVDAPRVKKTVQDVEKRLEELETAVGEAGEVKPTLCIVLNVGILL